MSTASEVKHTPGPWEADGAASPYKYHEGDHHHQIDAPTPRGADPKFPYTVADTSNRHHCISPEEDRANARLIAAAPAMLEALEKLCAIRPQSACDENPDHYPESCRWCKAKAVIRLAKGETK